MSQLKKSLEEMKNKTKGLDRTVKDTQTSVDNMSKSAVSGMKSTQTATQRTREEMQKLTQDVNKLIQSMTKGSKGAMLQIDMSEAKQELADTENLIKELYQELDGKQARLQAGVSGEEYKQLLSDIASLNGQLDDAEEEAQRLKAQLIMGDEGVVKTTTEIEEMKKELLKVSEALAKARNDLALMANQDVGSDETEEQIRLVGQLESQYRKLYALINHASTEANKPLEAPSSNKWAAVGAVINKCASGATKAAKAFAGMVGYIGKAGLEVTKFMAKLNPMPKLVEKLGRAWKSLREKIIAAFVYSAINTWFNNIRNQITSYLKVNNELQNALNRNTGAWLTAFQPIYEVVVPALVTLLNWLTKVGYAFAKFTSQLTGKTVAESQASAEALWNEASALEATGGAAEEAKKQLAGFDELNVLQDNSSGGGGGASTESKPEFGEIPETKEYATWGEAFSALLDKMIAKLPALHQALLNAADGINRFSANLLEMFTYDGVQDKVSTLASGIAEGLNGMVDRINWNQLGQALGAGIETALNFLTTFIDTFNWKKLGSGIADGINGIMQQVDGHKLGKLLVAPFNIAFGTLSGFVQKLDWNALGTEISDCFEGAITSIDWQSFGETLEYGLKGIITAITSFFQETDWGDVANSLSNGFKTVFDSLSRFLQETDWGEFVNAIVNGIVDFCMGFDWEGVASSIMEFAGSVIGASARLVVELAKSIGNLIGDAIAGAKEYFQEKIEECGGNVVAGILKGIVDAIAGIGQWIYNNIFKPFIDGFKKAFGIHSPSTVMAEQGRYIIEGLLNGMTEKWKELAKWISQAFNDLIKWCKDTWDSILKTAKDKWEDIKKNIGDRVTKIKEEVSKKWDELKTTLQNTMTNIKNDLENKWTTLKNNVTTTVQNLKTEVEQKWETFKNNLQTKMANLKQDIETKWTNLKTAISTKVSSIKSDVETKWENMKTNLNTKMDTMKANLSQKWENIKADFKTKVGNIKTDTETTFTNMKDAIVNIFGALKEALKTPINGIITVINSLLSLVTNGVNKIIDIINSVKFTIPSNTVTDFLGIAGLGWDGFNIPHVKGYSIPLLANGGVIDTPTLAMVGEYAGAKNNPEIVTPASLMKQIVAEGNDDIVNVLLQMNRQLIAAINGVDMDVIIGDDVIAKSVVRSNTAYKRMTGKPLLV